MWSDDVRWKSALRCGAKHISKSKCTKHLSFRTLWEVEMSKKCTPDHFWKLRCRKSARRCDAAHFQVKMHKTLQLRNTLGVQMSFCVARARDCAPCEKWAKCEGFAPVSNTTTSTIHYTTLHYTTLQTVYDTTQHSTPLHSAPLHSTPLHYTTLHTTTLHCTTLHWTTLHNITLDYTTLHYTTTPLHYTTLHYITLHFTQLHYATLHLQLQPQPQLQLRYSTPHCARLQ